LIVFNRPDTLHSSNLDLNVLQSLMMLKSSPWLCLIVRRFYWPLMRRGRTQSDRWWVEFIRKHQSMSRIYSRHQLDLWWVEFILRHWSKSRIYSRHQSVRRIYSRHQKEIPTESWAIDHKDKRKNWLVNFVLSS
jgi:hypothetical protein